MKICLKCSDVAYKEDAEFCIRHQLIHNWSINTSVDNLGFWEFCKKVIPRAFKNFEYGEPRFHREIAWEILRDQRGWKFYDRQVVIAVFRGSSKTTLSSKAIPLYHALLGTKKYIVIASKTQRSAEKNLRWIKQMLGNSRVIQIFGDLRPERFKTSNIDTIQGKWTSSFIILKNGVVIEAIGMGQHLRGSAEGEDVHRIDLFLADDTESDENTKTPERREDNKIWLFETVLPSLDVDTGTICFINTETHTESILSTLLKPESNWRKISYPVSYINDRGVEVATWAEKFSLKEIGQIKNNYMLVGRLSSFYKEYYNVIRSQRGFDDSLIKYWDGRFFQDFGTNWIELFNIDGSKTTFPVFTYLGIDGAYTFNKGSDYSALVPIAIDPMGRTYLLPYKRGRMSVFDRIANGVSTVGFVDEAERMHTMYNFNAIIFGVEGQQNGYYTQLKDKFSGRVRVIAHQNQGNKTDMLYDFLAPAYEAGLMYHMKGMPDIWRELISFGDTTDDILDALQMAKRYAKIPKLMEYNRTWGAMDVGDGIEGARPIRQQIKRVVNWITL